MDFLKGFGAKFSVMQTLSVAYEVQNSTTVSNTFTGMANITGPVCTGNPCNPPYPPSPQTYGEGTEFDIFVDHFFGTLLSFHLPTTRTRRFRANYRCMDEV